MTDESDRQDPNEAASQVETFLRGFLPGLRLVEPGATTARRPDLRIVRDPPDDAA